MRTYFISLVVALGACTDSIPTIDRVTACQAQADAWCSAAGYPTSGCHAWYVMGACASMDLDIGIPADMQAQCLADIAGPTIPESCESTWTLTMSGLDIHH